MKTQNTTTNPNPAGRRPPPISATKKKWVTFDDLIDEAMEDGKLCPAPAETLTTMINHHRHGSLTSSASSASLPTSYCSSSSSSSASMMSCSVSSTGSFDDDNNAAERKSSLDFSRSLDAGAMQGLRQPEAETEAETKPEVNGNDNDDDKYAKAFASIRGKRGLRYQGWSSAVLHGTEKMGWSDQLLSYEDERAAAEATEASEAGSGTDDEAQLTGTPTADAAWAPENGTAGTTMGLRNPTWDQSPRRTFVRNFP